MRRLIFVVLLVFPAVALAQSWEEGEPMVSFIATLQEYGEVILAAIGLFAAIATMTPNKSDNVIVDFLLKLVNGLGLNVGKARNDPENP